MLEEQIMAGAHVQITHAHKGGGQQMNGALGGQFEKCYPPTPARRCCSM